LEKEPVFHRRSILNFLYSILMILFFFNNSYIIENISFKWERLSYFIIIIIFANIIFQRLDISKIRIVLRDRYLYLMIGISIWGLVSSYFSIQRVLSIKKTISVFLVFTVFYLIPRYFFNSEERSNSLAFLTIPFNILMTILGTVNIIAFLELIDLKGHIEFWTMRATIYLNSNYYGLFIFILLLMMNAYLLLDDRLQKCLKNHLFLKIYVIFSYAILVINLVFSGSRTSVLGVAFVFIPLIYKFIKLALLSSIPVGYLVWSNKKELHIFGKVRRGGTSGRGKLWDHAISEIIPKHPILGVGSGAYRDYFEDLGNKSVHNAYLNLILTNGIVGFILWMTILAFIFHSIFKLKNNRYIFIFILLSFLAYGFFEIGLFGELGLQMSIFWTIIMLIENQIDRERLSI